MKAGWDLETAGGLIAAGGVGLAALSGVLRLPSAGLIGLAILGSGVCCWGISGMIEGRVIFFKPGVRHTQSHYGWGARAWGALLCLAGLIIIAACILLLLKPDVSLEGITSSPLGKGAVMFLCGLIGMLYSVTLMAGRAEKGSSWWRELITLPVRALGVLLLFFSLLIAAAGLLRAFAPAVYDGLVKAIW